MGGPLDESGPHHGDGDDNHQGLGDGDEEESSHFLLWRASTIRHLITLQSLVRRCGPLSN